MRRVILAVSAIMVLTACGASEATKEKELYCEEGTLENGKCNIVAISEAKYECKKGYTLDGTECTKEEKVSAKKTEKCESGYKLSGSTCVSEKTYDKKSKKVCEMPKNFTKLSYHHLKEVSESKGKCYLHGCSNASCDSGFVIEISYTTKKACPSGTKEIDGKCRKTSTPKSSYSCEEGKLDGKKCIIKKTKDAEVTCEDGYDYNSTSNKCEKVTVVEAKEK